MKDFIEYLNDIEALKHERKFDLAWQMANKGLEDLLSQGDDSWYMMYYQMADISAIEKNWDQALFHMGLVIHFLKRVGGLTHEKFIKKLLHEVGHLAYYNKFIELSLNTDPKELQVILQNEMK